MSGGTSHAIKTHEVGDVLHDVGVAVLAEEHGQIAMTRKVERKQNVLVPEDVNFRPIVQRMCRIDGLIVERGFEIDGGHPAFDRAGREKSRSLVEPRKVEFHDIASVRGVCLVVQSIGVILTANEEFRMTNEEQNAFDGIAFSFDIFLFDIRHLLVRPFAAEYFNGRTGFENVICFGIPFDFEITTQCVDQDFAFGATGEDTCDTDGAEPGSASECFAGTSFPNANVDLVGIDDLDEFGIYATREVRVLFDERTDSQNPIVVQFRNIGNAMWISHRDTSDFESAIGDLQFLIDDRITGKGGRNVDAVEDRFTHVNAGVRPCRF